MKISVVVSTYNGSEYIIEQLESLLKQSRQADEVLIFDDASKDSTPILVKQYIEKNNLHTWKFIVNEENIGWRRNFIQGMKKCSGELIFLCDQDDIWNFEKLKKMSAVMENNLNIGLLASTYIETYSDGMKKEFIYSRSKDEKIIKVKMPSNILDVPFPGCVYCVRKTFFDVCSKYWTETCPHDALLWRSAVLAEKAYVFNEPLILWRKHETSAWQQEIKTRNIKSELDWRKVEKSELEELLQYLKTEFSGNKEVDFANAIVKRNLDWCLTRTHWFREKRLSAGIDLIKYLNLYHGYKGWLKDLYLVFRGK